MSAPFTPEELEPIRREHRRVDGVTGPYCPGCADGFRIAKWPCLPFHLLATVDDRDQEIAKLRSGLTEVIDCSSGSNPEEIMAGIARRALENL